MKLILSTTVASTFVGAMLLTANAFAADGEYTLFNPTPDNALRPLRSDTADRVVGPYTVDAGHFQLEADLVNYLTWSETTHFPSGTEERIDDRFFWKPALKLGLCERADFEVKFSYSTDKFKDTFTTPSGSQSKFELHNEGFGDVQPGFKVNLWGNDGGTTALAVRPFLSIPPNNPSDVAGGIGFPFNVNLPEDFSIKIYQEVFFYEHGTLHTVYSADAAVHKSLLDSKVDAFANFTSTVYTSSSANWLGYVGFGAAYNFTSNFQGYAGLRFGLTSNAFDYNPYIGLTWRY